MMKRRDLLHALGLASLGCAGTSAAPAFASTPIFPLGRPAGVMLLTEGEDSGYRSVLWSVLQGLETVGLMPPLPPEAAIGGDSTAQLWALAVQSTAPKDENRRTGVRFLSDGHYSYGFNPRRSSDIAAGAIERIRRGGDVDLVLTLGGAPAEDLSKVCSGVPVVAMARGDGGALACPNIHATVVEDCFGRQARLFHAVRPYRKLALLAGSLRLATAGEDEIRSACADLGAAFEVVVYDERGDASDHDFASLMRGLEKVAALGCDAVVLPWFWASDNDFPAVVKLLTSRGIASFSQVGGDFVARGILLGAGEPSLEGYGLFEASVIRRILDGEPLSLIPRRFEQRGRLTLNLQTALQMGWRPPFDLLVSVEKAYTSQSRFAGDAGER